MIDADLYTDFYSAAKNDDLSATTATVTPTFENFIFIGASGLYTVRLKEVKGKPSISALTQAYARVSIRVHDVKENAEAIRREYERG